MRELYTEIEINASPQRVWNLLTDFPGLPAWNPFIQQASGQIERGERLTVHLHPPDGPSAVIKPRLINVDPERELRWLGHLLIPGLFDGEHIFAIEPLDDNRVRFIQREVFKGVFVPLILWLIGQNTRQGFEAMNQALKAEAEAEKQ